LNADENPPGGLACGSCSTHFEPQTAPLTDVVNPRRICRPLAQDAMGGAGMVSDALGRMSSTAASMSQQADGWRGMIAGVERGLAAQVFRVFGVKPFRKQAEFPAVVNLEAGPARAREYGGGGWRAPTVPRAPPETRREHRDLFSPMNAFQR